MAKSVLVVEDEPNIVIVLSLEYVIKKAGYEVRVARDGEEALKAVEEAAPDLILLDVMIPKRDGYDVCQTIRANPAWNDVNIIMLTARGTRRMKSFTCLLKMAVWDRTATSLARAVVFTCT